MDPTFLQGLQGKYDQAFSTFDSELSSPQPVTMVPYLSRRMAVGPNQLTPTQQFLQLKTRRGVAAGLAGLVLIGLALRTSHPIGKGLLGGLGVCSLGGGIAYALIGRSQYLDLDDPDVIANLPNLSGFATFCELIDHLDRHHYVYRDPTGKLQTERFRSGHLYHYHILQNQTNAGLTGLLTDAYVAARHQHDKDVEYIDVMYNRATAKDRLEKARVMGEAARDRSRAAHIDAHRSWKQERDNRNFNRRWDNSGGLGRAGATLAHGVNWYDTYQMGVTAQKGREAARMKEEAANDWYEGQVAPIKEKRDEAQHYLSELMRLYIKPYVNGAFNCLQANQPITSRRSLPNLPRWVQQRTTTYIRV